MCIFILTCIRFSRGRSLHQTGLFPPPVPGGGDRGKADRAVGCGGGEGSLRRNWGRCSHNTVMPGIFWGNSFPKGIMNFAPGMPQSTSDWFPGPDSDRAGLHPPWVNKGRDGGTEREGEGAEWADRNQKASAGSGNTPDEISATGGVAEFKT